MTISVESLVIIAVIVAVVLFAGRLLAWLLGLLVLAFAIVFGLALASDLYTGGHALQALADKLTPAVGAIGVTIIGWLKQQKGGDE